MSGAVTLPTTRGTTMPTLRWWALVAPYVGLFMALLDAPIVTLALPLIGRALPAGFSAVPWVINAYTRALVVVLVTVGRLGDRCGRTHMVMLGRGSVTLAALCCALSSDVSVGGLSLIAIPLAARAPHGAQ